MGSACLLGVAYLLAREGVTAVKSFVMAREDDNGRAECGGIPGAGELPQTSYKLTVSFEGGINLFWKSNDYYKPLGKRGGETMPVIMSLKRLICLIVHFRNVA